MVICDGNARAVLDVYKFSQVQVRSGPVQGEYNHLLRSTGRSGEPRKPQIKTPEPLGRLRLTTVLSPSAFSLSSVENPFSRSVRSSQGRRSAVEMKVVALVSGGKDSCYAMMKCIHYGHEVFHSLSLCASLFGFSDEFSKLAWKRVVLFPFLLS